MRNSYDQLICVFFRMFSLLVPKDTEKLFSFSIKKLALANELNRNTMLINNTKTGLLVRIYTVVVRMRRRCWMSWYGRCVTTRR